MGIEHSYEFSATVHDNDNHNTITNTKSRKPEKHIHMAQGKKSCCQFKM